MLTVFTVVLCTIYVHTLYKSRKQDIKLAKEICADEVGDSNKSSAIICRSGIRLAVNTRFRKLSQYACLSYHFL